MAVNVAVVAYGVGNIRSVTAALRYVGASPVLTDDPAELERADAVILPGVGAFPNAMRRLSAAGLAGVLTEQAARKPILGICLGMQLLFDMSDEVEATAGLSLINGNVKLIETSLKLPHIGWNDLKILRPCELTKGLPTSPYVYFVHSFRAESSSENTAAVTEYGGSVITAIAQNGNIFGCQFHPEKSGDVGLQILKNFTELSL